MTNNTRITNGECFAVIGNLTSTMRAQSVLDKTAIPTNIAKKSGVRENRGCLYVLEFPCNQAENVRHALERANIKVKGWEGKTV